MTEKLVRDKIVDNAIAKGDCPEFYIVDGDQKYLKLVEKLAEEKKELVEAIKGTKLDEICEEIVDLQDVINTISGDFFNLITDPIKQEIKNEINFIDQIMQEYKINGNMIQEIRQQKFKTKGAFEKGIVMISKD